MSNHFNENMSKFKDILTTKTELIKNNGRRLKASIQNINIDNTVYSNPWYFGLVELFQYLVILFIIYKYNPFHIATNYPVFTNITVLLITFIYVVLFYFIKAKINLTPAKIYTDAGTSDTQFIFKVVNTLGVFIGLIVLILGVLWLLKNTAIVTTIIRHALLIFIIITVLSIIYILTEKTVKKYYSTHNNNITAIGAFLFDFLMFTPCLLIRFINYIKEQYKLTTKPIWILVIFEIILIALWFIIPIAFHAVTTHDGKQLISEPKYLNEQHTLGNFENLNDESNTNKNKKFTYRYSLSGWFYINPQPPNTSGAYTRYTSLLNYGNKPDIQFNGKLNSLRIMTQAGKSDSTDNGDLIEIYETKNIVYQKWNYFVINYDGGTMDIFLNGELVSSRPNIAPYMTYETVTSGTENGIHGGICNVIYYNSLMKTSTIELTYRLLRDKKIPLHTF